MVRRSIPLKSREDPVPPGARPVPPAGHHGTRDQESQEYPRGSLVGYVEIVHEIQQGRLDHGFSEQCHEPQAAEDAQYRPARTTGLLIL